MEGLRRRDVLWLCPGSTRSQSMTRHVVPSRCKRVIFTNPPAYRLSPDVKHRLQELPPTVLALTIVMTSSGVRVLTYAATCSHRCLVPTGYFFNPFSNKRSSSSLHSPITSILRRWACMAQREARRR